MIYGELELFLTGLGLNQLVQLFQEQQVDFDMFLRMTDEDFIKVKVNLQHISSMTKKKFILIIDVWQKAHILWLFWYFPTQKLQDPLKNEKESHTLVIHLIDISFE